MSRLFHFLAIVNSVAINPDMQVSLWRIDLNLLGRYPGEVWLRHMILLFLNIYGNFQIGFHSDCVSLHFHEQWIKVPQQYSLSFVFLMTACLTQARWDLKAIYLALSPWTEVWNPFPNTCLFVFPLWELTIQFISPLIDWKICLFHV